MAQDRSSSPELDTFDSTAVVQEGSGTRADALPVNRSVVSDTAVISNNDNKHRRFYEDNLAKRGSPYRQPLKLGLNQENQAKSLYPEEEETDCLLTSSLKNNVSLASPDGEKPSLHVQFNHVDDVDDHDDSVKEQPSPLSIDSDSSSSSSSSSSEESIEISEARPPDGGWGWVVVVASFVVNLIADGITFSFGVIFVEFLDYFGENRGKTAWIGSLFMAMPLLSGPIASFLTDRYGCRAVTMAGSVMAASGFVISSMSNSMELLFITFGIFAGFGLSLCYVASVVIVAYYFDKKRSFATGLSVCGSGIGTFIFAPLIQVLLKHYGWRGTTLILAGLFLNLAVCGALMRDLPWTPSSLKSKERKKNKILKKKKSQSSADTFSVSNSTNTASVLQPILETNENAYQYDDEMDPHSNYRLSSSLVNLPTYVKNGEKVPIEVLELLSKNPSVYHVLMHNYPNLLTPSRSFSDSGRLNEAHLQQKHTVPSPLSIDPPMTQNQQSDAAAFLWWLKRSDISPPRMSQTKKAARPAYLKDLRVHRLSLTYRGAMLNINRYRLRASSCPDIYRNSMTTIAKEKHDWTAGFRDLKKILVDMFDFSHFADPKFLIFAISNFLLYTWYDVPYMYLSDYATKIGLTEEDGSFLISNIGIINMGGEILLGWAGDRPELNAGIIYAICMGLCGAATAIIPILRSYGALLVATGAFGMFIAANYSLTCIILVDLLSLDKFTNAYGLLLLVQGVANLVGPPIAGWIYDITGKYDLSFYLSGLFIGLSGLLLFILPATNRYRRFQTLQRQASSDCSIGDVSSPKEPRFHVILTSCITGRVDEKAGQEQPQEHHV